MGIIHKSNSTKSRFPIAVGERDFVYNMTWEYLAGFFDGEGSIVLREKIGDGIHLSIAQKVPGEAIKEIYYFLKEKGFSPSFYFYNNGKIDCIQVVTRRTRENIILLKKLTPLLIEKKKKAEKAIKILEEYLNTKKRMRPLSKKLIQFAINENISLSIEELNKITIDYH